jgi:excinuclease ABC subunit A
MQNPKKAIVVRGASEHNLKQVDVSIPRDKLTVITGVSGSGKSSLAFDTIFAEGQRKYMESLSSYARQFLNKMDKPDVESIEGLPPTIAIAQRSASHNPRSTVATTTEIYDYLRLLMARCGTPRCWHKSKNGKKCNRAIESTTATQIINSIMKIKGGTKIMICSPLVAGRKGFHREVLEDILAKGFVRARVDKEIVDLRKALIDDTDNPLQIARYELHNIEAVVDRVVVNSKQRERIADSVGIAIELGCGSILILSENNGEWIEQRFSEHFACPNHPNFNLLELEPRLFSFNSHYGACPNCDGLGTVHEFDPLLIVQDKSLPLTRGAISPWHLAGPAVRRRYQRILRRFCDIVGISTKITYSKLTSSQKKLLLHGGRATGSKKNFIGVIPVLEKRFKHTESDNVRTWLMKYMTKMSCHKCEGQRLKVEARSVTVTSNTGTYSISELTEMTTKELLETITTLQLGEESLTIADPIILEIKNRLAFLISVGLDYLSLSRASSTLSGGEAQRIRLATQVGSGLVGVCYVLDEPTIGLHARDNKRLLETLKHLTTIGNTVLVVEHDDFIIRSADHIIDVGPSAGIHGGKIVAEGDVVAIENNPCSLTGKYLSGELGIPLPTIRRPISQSNSISIRKAVKNNLKKIDVDIPLGCLVCVTGVSGSGKSSLINNVLLEGLSSVLQRKKISNSLCNEIKILGSIDRIIEVDQSPIGRTPRSNPATYTGIFGGIRTLFSQTRESKIRGYKPGRFSFNVKGGRCEACQGQGVKKIEMHFLPDTYVTCEECCGSRFNSETLEVQWRNYTISQILGTTIEKATDIYENHCRIERMLNCLQDVGLGYLTLGQPSTTLSGGEAQRIKLASELGIKTNNHTLYILDEPTTGLHFDDIVRLLEVIQRLIEAGNSVVVIEHNLDVIKCADWIIDLGPEGGDAGGLVVTTGTPEQVAKCKKSYTGYELSQLNPSTVKCKTEMQNAATFPLQK